MTGHPPLPDEDTVSSQELREVLLHALTVRRLSIRQFEALCLDRYRHDPHPLTPGETRRTMSQLARTARCPVSTADRLLTALSMSLHDLASYRALPAPFAREDILHLPGLAPCP